MTSHAALPRSIATPSDAAALQACARRVQTPCGDGAMVWHLWGEGSPVLLLHGGSGSWNHWVRNIAPLVEAGRLVCVPDLPGSGDSASPPHGHDADALPQWVETGLDALLGGAPCDVAAFSFGTMVAAFLVAQHPQRVRRLVLSGAPALSTEPTRPHGLRDWSRVPEGPQRDAAHRHNLGRLMLAREASIDALALALHAANVVRDRMKRRRLSQTDVMLRTLPQLRCPVWGLWGAEDVLYRERTHVLVPGLSAAPDFRSLTLIPAAGHWVQYEAAATFNDTLGALLAMPL